MNKDLMFSSKNYEWETPPEVFEWIDRKWEITIDACATPGNAKCERFISPAEDFFQHNFIGEVAFMNPPYGRGIANFVEKAYTEALKPNTIFICLLPARTDTRWWHRYVMKSVAIYLIQGRIKFLNEDGERVASAPYPSAIVFFDGQSRTAGCPRFRAARFKYRKGT